MLYGHYSKVYEGIASYMVIICEGSGLDLTAFPEKRVNFAENSKSKNQLNRVRVVATQSRIVTGKQHVEN